ncbi:protein containg molybdenum cofactor synthesis domain [Longilinea arvoryzae]|uniref:CinA-like protein n=1 Tax=Longilinea arvoryzae TaxID=360412 RepID=A0A0S7BB72_9CHLR|nr:CinA family nicotinamide mononucleotide deamidase-related protein [Longilinea arvoryzae]GAP15004.1 protein containg molybdenum cofactor synthesis domain [Longilinea arvoryzae]
MPVAEIIAIGTELLLGEIQDTNTHYLARALRDKGIDVFRATLVGDNAQRISALIREAAARADILITTGGLGPTVDDPTRDAIALAMGVESKFEPELWRQIETRYARMGRNPTENNKRQAYLPLGAHGIENPVGTAPAFWGKIGTAWVFCLPGVPREMEYLLQNAVFPLLEERFDLYGTIQALVLHCAGVGESQVDEWVGDFETYPNPTVGLAAHPGIVDIRITAKAASLAEAGQMISPIAEQIRQRIGDAIFGQDDDTLEGTVIDLLRAQGRKLLIAGDGSQSALFDRLAAIDSHAILRIESGENQIQFLSKALHRKLEGNAPAVGLAVSLTQSEQARRNRLEMAFITDLDPIIETRQYGGPDGNIPEWATNTALNFVRISLLSHPSDKE